MNDGLRLYFLRHGLADRSAYSGGDDHERPLTGEGKQRMRREAEFMARLGVAPDLILTSPLVRARQTAEIVAARLGLTDRLRQEKRLGLDFDTERLAAILASLEGDHREIMLVGHEPSFSEVVGEITGGSLVVCKKGGLARVDLAAGQKPLGQLVWLLPPKALLC
jgi:phosphohistidine phosphatase